MALKVKYISTDQNVSIPILISPTLTVSEIINKIYQDGVLVQSTPDDVTNKYLNPRDTLSIFDCTESELFPFMNSESIGNIVLSSNKPTPLTWLSYAKDDNGILFTFTNKLIMKTSIYDIIPPYDTLRGPIDDNGFTYDFKDPQAPALNTTVSIATEILYDDSSPPVAPVFKRGGGGQTLNMRCATKASRFYRRGVKGGVKATKGVGSCSTIPILVMDSVGDIITFGLSLCDNELFPSTFRNNVCLVGYNVSSSVGDTGRILWNGYEQQGTEGWYSYGSSWTIVKDDSNTEPEPEPIIGGGIVDLSNRFSPRIEGHGVGAYPITKNQLISFNSDIWETTFAEKVLSVINGSALESVIALRWYYGIRTSIPKETSQAYVTLGQTPFNGVSTQSSIVTYPAKTEFLTYNMGTVYIRPKFGNFLDSSPFTEVQLYLPYHGFVSLNPTEVMGKDIRIDYNINIVTGACIIYLYIKIGVNDYRVIMEIPCSIGMDIPMNVSAKETIQSRLVTAAVGVGAVGLGTAVAGAGGAIGAMAGSNVISNIGESIGNNIQSPNLPSGDIKRSGGLDNETSSLAYLTAFAIISRPKIVAPPDYNDLIGTPSFKSGLISGFTGYIKVGAIKQSNITGIPKPVYDEIETMLKGGVYVE